MLILAAIAIYFIGGLVFFQYLSSQKGYMESAKVIHRLHGSGMNFNLYMTLFMLVFMVVWVPFTIYSIIRGAK